MVDSRKSAQAKQQRRNRDGTYADEGKTSSMPTGDVLERFEQNQGLSLFGVGEWVGGVVVLVG